MAERRAFHTGTMRRTVTANAPKEKAWAKVSQIAGLSWVEGVKSVAFLSKARTGSGAVRQIAFLDGNTVEEHIVGWKRGEYFSYVAVSGLPLRAYHATISLASRGKDRTQITWQSYFNSQKMTRGEFLEFVSFIGSFYAGSLKNLKACLEA